MHTRTRALAALVAVTGLTLPAAAHADTTLTFKEVNKGSTFNFVDNPPKAKNRRNPSLSPGDFFVFSNPLADNTGKHIGTLRAQCTITKASKSFDKGAPAICFGAFSLPNGILDAMASENDINAPTTSGVIIGGTGDYVGARGTFASKTTKTGNNDTITLLG